MITHTRGGLAVRMLVPWLLLVCAWPVLAAPGEFHVKHLGIVEGLAQSSGSAIAQDAQGFLWMGTQSGLQRYDGYDFVYYHHQPGRAGSLSQDDVRGLAAGDDGSIWVATGHGGLDRLKPDREGFEHFVHRAGDPASLASDELNALLLDHDGRLWIAGNAGVDRLEEGGTFRHYHTGGVRAGDQRSYALAEDSSERLWVGTAAGLFVLDPGTGKLLPFVAGPDSEAAAGRALAAATINCIAQGRDGHLWVGTTRGLFVLGGDLRIVKWLQHADDDPATLASNHVRAVLEDANGTVWIGMYGGGLDRLDPTMRGWKILHERHAAAQPDGLASDYVLSLFADAGGLVWIGTDGGGFDIYNPRSRAFGSLRHEVGDPHSIADDIVWAIDGDAAGNLWVGTQSGLTYLAKQPADNRQYVFAGDRGHRDDAQPAFSLFLDPAGTLWVGSGAGLFRNRGAGTAFVPVDVPAPEKGAGGKLRLTQVLGAPDGRLWLATASSLMLFDPASGKVVRRFLPGQAKDALPALVTTMCETTDGTLWVGTELGLRRLDAGTNGFSPSRAPGSRPGVLATSDVLSCLAAPDGDLWVGTTSGLVRLRPATGFEHDYGMSSGLPSPTIYAMLRDSAGALWASTGRGLVRIDPDSGQVRSFDRTDGLDNEEFNQLAAYEHDGVLYFGGIHGVTMVYPAHLQRGAGKARVGITRYTVSGRDQDSTYHAPLPGLLHLRYWQNALTFDVAMFDYAAPLENRFSYRLDGFDAGWHELKDRHTITYTNLEPGSYTLRVKGMDGNGRPSVNVATMAFDVETPPWLRPWAWLLYVGVGLLVAALGLNVFAVWIRRRRDLAGEQQRRRLAESLHEVVHAISRLDDQRAITFALVQRLPELIPHEHAALWTDGESGLELVSMRGFAGVSKEALREWALAHLALVGELNREGRARRLEPADTDIPGVAPGTLFMAMPLKAADDVRRLLLIGRNDKPFRQDELDLAAVLERQVSVMLDKARLIHQLETLARTDSLTGADNRRWFLQQADGVFERCLRQGTALALLLFDVDHFKRVNDKHGHAVGDTVLVELVARCRAALRGEDIFGRYGGEEFAVCLPATDLASALAMAERLREAICASPIPTTDGELRVTASFGVAGHTPVAGDSLRAMIAAADQALYAAKRNGRNCVRGPNAPDPAPA